MLKRGGLVIAQTIRVALVSYMFYSCWIGSLVSFYAFVSTGVPGRLPRS